MARTRFLSQEGVSQTCDPRQIPSPGLFPCEGQHGVGWLGALTLIYLEVPSPACSLACLWWAGPSPTDTKFSGTPGFWFPESKARTGTWLRFHLLGIPGLVYFSIYTLILGYPPP